MEHEGATTLTALNRPPSARFHRPPMRIPRVAVGAAELAADIGIDRPEPHAGGSGCVEHRVDRQADEPGAAVALVEDGKAGKRGSGAAGQ